MVKKAVIGIAWLLISITKAMDRQPPQYQYRTWAEQFQNFLTPPAPAPSDDKKDQSVQTSSFPSVIYLTNQRSFILMSIKCKKIPDPATFQKKSESVRSVQEAKKEGEKDN